MENVIRHPGGLVAMPGFQARRDGAGLWTGTQKYHCRENELARVMPRQGASHAKMNFMAVDEVEFEILQEGLCVVTAHYAGASFGGGAGGEPEDEYILAISTGEEPVGVHHRYEGLSDFDVAEAVELGSNPPKTITGMKLREVDQTGWPALKSELFQDVQRGMESYFEPRATWTRRWVSEEVPSELNEIAKISTPTGSPPPPGAGRNWLNMGIRSQQRGKVYENEMTWELSGRGGWDEKYYA
tara:strand:- start:6074 stop:6799 length:726 start_codon:yes stop_codon:yes gene_type:complete